MGSIIPSKGYFVADNNVPALCTTKQRNGTVWIFYYSPIPSGREIRFSAWNPDPTVKAVPDQEISVTGLAQGPVIDGDFSDIACTTWNDEVHVYYIAKSTRLIKGVYYDQTDKTWKPSSINNLLFSASTLSPLCAIGNAGLNKDQGTVSVLFLDQKNNDELTEACYYKDGVVWKWKKVAVPADKYLE